jgi:outer membrane biogenesis lipoprotein LolB
MKRFTQYFLALYATSLLVASAGATGLATCDSGSKETWQPQEKLEEAAYRERLESAPY